MDKLSRRCRCAPLVPLYEGVDPISYDSHGFIQKSFILIPIDGQTAVITGHHLGVQDNVIRSSSRVTKFGSTRIRVNPALGLLPLHCGHYGTFCLKRPVLFKYGQDLVVS